MSSDVETAISIPKDQGKIMEEGVCETQTGHGKYNLVSEEAS